jgi:electron transfer flavoprotein alpha subunit
MNIEVEEAVCTKCGICRKYCSFDAIEYKDGLPVFNFNCVLCGACVKPCPYSAISIDRKALQGDLSGYSGVMAFIEIENDGVKQVGLEMLSAAKRLADKLGESCSAVVLGADVEKTREILSDYGAEKIFYVQNEELITYNTEIYTNIIAGIISKYRPSIVLFGATHLGRDLAPRVAGRIDTGLTADCTGLELNKEGNLLQIRPTFGGDIMATIITPNHRPQMATVRPNVIKRIKQYRKDGKAAEIEKIVVDIDLKIQKIKLIDEVMEVSPFSNVGEADYIVSGGKGVGKAENFNLLKDLVRDLAEMVGESRVALGASRAAVDAGWIPHQHQVGQTGKAVTPRLYIACGISIFRMADLGIVGDLKEVIPKLKDFLRKNITR